MGSENSPVYLTQKRAAEVLGVHLVSVRRWCRSGKLASVRFGNGVIRVPLWAVFPPEAFQRLDRPAEVVKVEPKDAPGQTLLEFRECS
ncbi:MAG: helix-turn-helix domain-containing protein [Planctomycetota bacterium]|jgi:excisionase family DNA binding protein